MHLQINSGSGVTVSEALEAHLRDQLETIDRRFGEQITRIEAFFADVNGPKGGVDKQCRLEARPRGLDAVAAEHSAESAYDAASGAASRLEKVLDKRFGRLEARS